MGKEETVRLIGRRTLPLLRAAEIAARGGRLTPGLPAPKAGIAAQNPGSGGERAGERA